MKPRSNPFLRSVALAAITLAASASSAFAAAVTYAWEGNTSGDLTNALNWVGGTAPAATGDAIRFGVAGTAGTSLNLATGMNVGYGALVGGAIQFNSDASAYTLSGAGLITLSTGAIVNNSSNAQIINNNLKRNTGNAITIGGNNGGLVLNGNYDINAGALSTVAFGNTTGGYVLFNGPMTNTGAAGTYGFTATGGSGYSTVHLANTSSVINGTLTLGTNSTLKVGAYSGSSVVNGSNNGNTTLWLASDSALGASGSFAYAPVVNSASSHSIILGSAGGAAVTNQTISTLALNSQMAVNFFKAGNVSSGTPKVTITSLTMANGNRTNILAAYDVDLEVQGISINAGTSSYATGVLDGNTIGSSVTGVISNGAGTLGLAKAGTGTWSLSGANTYTGSTVVNNGTLKLDFNATGAAASDILYNGVADGAVYLNGGNLSLAGKNATASSQQLGAITAVGHTDSKIILRAGISGGSTTLNFTGLTLNTGAALDFDLGAGTTVNNSGATASSFVGAFATVNSTQFARYDGSKNVVAAVTGDYTGTLLTTNAGSTSSYYYLDGGNTRVNGDANPSFSFKGLRIANTANSQTLDLNGDNLIGSNSGLLYVGGNDNNYTITNGNIQANNAEIQFNVVSGATLTVSNTAAMTGTSGGNTLIVSKAGDGTLKVQGAKDFNSKLYVTGGTYSFDTIANGGSNSGLGKFASTSTNFYIDGGTVQYTGGNGSTDRSFVIGVAGATLDASGTSGALTWAPGSALVITGADNIPGPAKTNPAQNNNLTFTGSNTNDNTFGSTLGLITNSAHGRTIVTKSGVGKWILTGANTYTGPTLIQDGTLGLGNASALGTLGAITFSGGTMQYQSGITTDYSYRLLHSTSAIKVDTNGQAVTFGSRIDESNVGGLTLNDTAVTKGTLTLSGVNSYSGVTSVAAGTLVINGDNSAATGNVTVSGTGTKLKGTGTIGGDVTIQVGAIHAPGNSVGKQTIDEAGAATANLTYNQGSIFEWELGAALKDSTDGTRGTDYDAVNVSGTLGTTGTGAIFRVVLGDATNFAATFWDSDHTWTDIFKTSDSGSAVSFVSVFNAGAIQYWNSSGAISNTNGTGRSFTISGSSLTWSAVPEPTSALAGLLITAGLLRRRRERKF